MAFKVCLDIVRYKPLIVQRFSYGQKQNNIESCFIGIPLDGNNNSWFVKNNIFFAVFAFTQDNSL